MQHCSSTVTKQLLHSFAIGCDTANVICQLHATYTIICMPSVPDSVDDPSGGSRQRIGGSVCNDVALVTYPLTAFQRCRYMENRHVNFILFNTRLRHTGIPVSALKAKAR